MIINEIFFDNYRNLKKNKLKVDSGVNVIYGDNAQGKTNLLELIWLFTGGRSFRSSKDKELISFGENKSEIGLKFYSCEREQDIKIIINNDNGVTKKTAYLNKVYKNRSSLLIGKFCAVIFSPVNLNLIKEGPSIRRKFIDAAICQINPSYVYLLSKYNRILAQRNVILKEIYKRQSDKKYKDMIEVWDEELIKSGVRIIESRIDYCEKIKKYTDRIYKDLNLNNESINLKYYTLSNNNLLDDFRNRLRNKLESDIILGSTSVGPHRDDVYISLNDKSAKSFASQGQQRFIVLSLKLAEAQILKKYIGENPIILLDDVMSELDKGRQNYILGNIEDFQVFITCCEKNKIINKSNSKLINIKNGEFNIK